MKVLIGENKRSTRTLLKNSMEVLGHEVNMVKDEHDLMGALKDEDYEILFLSSTLSKRDVLETLRDVKHTKDRDSYVILMTPEGTEEIDMIEALEAGADDFLSKPLNRDLIRSRMRKARISLGVKERGLTVEPMEELEEEHELLRRLCNILEVVHYRIKEEVPEKVIDWIESATMKLEQEVHHEKEKYFLISFIENAMEEQGEDPDSRLFSRASLKQVEEEHEELEKMSKEIKEIISDYKEEKVKAGVIREMLKDYKDLLRAHLDREEKFLFPLARRYMDEETSTELMHKFDSVNEKVGRDKIQKFKRQISKGEETLYLK